MRVISIGLGLCLCFCSIGLSANAAAQQPITNNDFAIDIIATPAQGSGRIISLGGASTALAEGVSSVPVNPAGYAARSAWERDWWEYELGFSLQFSGVFRKTDYFLNGGRALGVDHFSRVDVSGRVQLGDFGLGASTGFQSFRSSDDDPTSINLTTTRIGLGYALLGGDLVIGAGVRILAFDIRVDEVPLVELTGTSLEVGFLLRPAHSHWRIGAALRSPASATLLDTDSDGQVAGYWLPTSANSPWEFSAGFAYQWFERPFNPRFLREKDVALGLQERLDERRCERMRAQLSREHNEPWSPTSGARCVSSSEPSDPEWWRAETAARAQEDLLIVAEARRLQAGFHDYWRALYESRARRFFLLTADIIVLGQTDGGIGVDAFVRQERIARGRQFSVGVRVGAESEVWPHRLKLRLGSYYEPARYEGVDSRLHATAGFDLRLFPFLGVDWQVTMFADVAPRYVNWGISIGAWH